jgi:hypothetical protein
MTLERAVKTVPSTIERKVRAGSPSSRSETMNRETSAPAEISIIPESKTIEEGIRVLTSADHRVPLDILYVLMDLALPFWVLSWRTVVLVHCLDNSIRFILRELHCPNYF